jgi:ABC-type sulfate/molybdate transport systems ATPase subunit
MVTHDPRVLSFGDRIIHLEDGRIAREEMRAANETETSSLFEGAGQVRVAEEIRFGL